MNRLLIVGFLLVSTLYAQGQQPNLAKLKADAQKVVSIIRGDKAKTQAYCKINSLGGEIDLAAQARDEQKADALTKKINDLEKQLGPEYVALFDALNKTSCLCSITSINPARIKHEHCSAWRLIASIRVAGSGGRSWREMRDARLVAAE